MKNYVEITTCSCPGNCNCQHTAKVVCRDGSKVVAYNHQISGGEPEENRLPIWSALLPVEYRRRGEVVGVVPTPSSFELKTFWHVGDMSEKLAVALAATPERRRIALARSLEGSGREPSKAQELLKLLKPCRARLVVLRRLKEATNNRERGEILLAHQGLFIEIFTGKTRENFLDRLEVGDFTDPHSIAMLGAMFGH